MAQHRSAHSDLGMTQRGINIGTKVMIEAPAAHLGAQRGELRIEMRLAELREYRLGRHEFAGVVGQAFTAVKNPYACRITLEERNFQSAGRLHPNVFFLHLGIEMKGEEKLARRHRPLQLRQAAARIAVELTRRTARSTDI